MHGARRSVVRHPLARGLRKRTVSDLKPAVLRYAARRLRPRVGFAPLISVTHWSDRTSPATDGSTTTMIGTDTISRVIGQDVYDESGEKIGSAAEVYLDDETGQPEWVTVRTGLF